MNTYIEIELLIFISHFLVNNKHMLIVFFDIFSRVIFKIGVGPRKGPANINIAKDKICKNYFRSKAQSVGWAPDRKQFLNFNLSNFDVGRALSGPRSNTYSKKPTFKFVILL